jgi:hypothetical protein
MIIDGKRSDTEAMIVIHTYKDLSKSNNGVRLMWLFIFFKE